jgi:uncharacterized protein (DUF433 family)
MNKPDYLHTTPFAVAVLAGNAAALPDGKTQTGAKRRSLAVEGGSAPWLPIIKSAGVRSVRLEQWFSECVLWGHEALQKSVEIDPKRRGGFPVLKGTRFTVGQTLAELADSAGVPEVANRFDLNEETIRELLYGLALLVERPCR